MVLVSLTFFCNAIKALTRQHGNRLLDANGEKLRAALQEAEQHFLAMPPVEKKPRKPRKVKDAHS